LTPAVSAPYASGCQFHDIESALPRIGTGVSVEVNVCMGGIWMGNAVAVTDQSFETEVLGSQVPVLVDFWAAWCGPCRQIAPVVEELSVEYAGRLKVTKVDVDENQQISERYRVMSIPTLLVFKGGQEVERIVGALPKQMLVSKLSRHL
jgi:thioredoxin 1